MLQSDPTCAPFIKWANAQILVPGPTSAVSQSAFGWTKTVGSSAIASVCASTFIVCAPPERLDPISGFRGGAEISPTSAEIQTPKSVRLSFSEYHWEVRPPLGGQQLPARIAPNRLACSQAQGEGLGPLDLSHARLPSARSPRSFGPLPAGWLRSICAVAMILCCCVAARLKAPCVLVRTSAGRPTAPKA